MLAKEIIFEYISDPKGILNRIKKSLPPKNDITGFTLRVPVKGGKWEIVSNSGSGPITTLLSLTKMLRQIKAKPNASLFVTYWLPNTRFYERKIPSSFLK